MKEYHLSVNGHDYVITLKSLSGDRAEMEVNGDGYVVDIHSVHRKESPQRRSSPCAPRTDDDESRNPLPTKMMQTNVADGVTAPIPGVIMEVYVKEGERVAAGADLLKMEAMKLENRITAPRAGTVVRIVVKAGDPVGQGQVLVELK